MNASDVVQLIRADPGTYAEAFRVCAGTLWHRHDITGLVKVDDMLLVNAGAAGIGPAVLTGAGREAAAHALGEALHGMAVSRAARDPDVWTGCRPGLPCGFGGPFAAGHVQPDVVPPMVASANPITGSVKASMRGRCPCRSADGRPRRPICLVNLPSAQLTGIVSGQGLTRRATGDQGPKVN